MIRKIEKITIFRYYMLNFLPLFLIVNTQIQYTFRKGQLLFDIMCSLHDSLRVM